MKNKKNEEKCTKTKSKTEFDPAPSCSIKSLAVKKNSELPKEKKQKQKRFAIKNNQMMLEETEKPKSTQINDKRYYFSNGIVLLPFSHPFLLEIVKFKREKNKKLKQFYGKKNIN